MRLVRSYLLIIVLAAIVLVLASACSRAVATTATPTLAPAQPASAEIVKPKPVVLAVSASTSGMFDSYYAVLDVTLRNDGADGMVILVGSINQANTNTKGELPLYLGRNITQTVRLVLPLKWRGGDWTPSAVLEVP